MKLLIIVRGLPGSGKTTLAENTRATLGNSHVELLETDMFFLASDDSYNFNPSKLGEAHSWCLNHAMQAMRRDNAVVIVSNTFSQFWEMQPYLTLAEIAGREVRVLDLFDGGFSDDELWQRNKHGVPLETIKAMRARWEKTNTSGQKLV